MNNCTRASVFSVIVGGLLVSLVVPDHPEKPFVEENVALRADNAMLSQKLIEQANMAVVEEKKRTLEALKSCQK